VCGLQIHTNRSGFCGFVIRLAYYKKKCPVVCPTSLKIIIIMDKFYLSISILLLFTWQSKAQTYADDVAQIMFDKCTSCHHSGGIAPFPLMTYSQVSGVTSMIQPSINSGFMPPWSPNNNYQQYAHDRSLSAAQITTINNWINAGAPEGNSANTPPAPSYNNNSQLGTPDFSVQIPTYASKATSGNDDYVCFSIPTGLLTSETIQAIEIIPGNPSIVHHVVVYADTAGTYTTDTTSHICGGPTGQNTPLIAAYAPGTSPAQFPNSSILKMGIDLPPGSNIVLAMHYPEGSQGEVDSTKINFHFYPQGTSGIRQVSAAAILYNYTFNINANTVDSVQSWYPGIASPSLWDYTLYSVFPHAHLLGKSFIVYAYNPIFPFDEIPLIHIPKWDFEWQDFYVFKYLQKIPAGYILYGKAVYDNTTNNPFNPNTPPINVGFGLNTTDEMFFVTFQYMAYQAGDEFINVDSLLKLQDPSVGIEPIAFNDNDLFLTSYPNPSNDVTTLQYYTKNTEEVSLGIYDMQGKLIRQLITKEKKQGQQFISWTGSDAAGNTIPPGIYAAQLKVGNKIITHKIVRGPK